MAHLRGVPQLDWAAFQLLEVRGEAIAFVHTCQEEVEYGSVGFQAELAAKASFDFSDQQSHSLSFSSRTVQILLQFRCKDPLPP